MTTAALTALVSTIVAPVALITPTAILLGNFMNKYTGIAAQIRQLSDEYRLAETTDARRVSIRGQIALFHKRITAMWAASGTLLMALLAFLVTILTLLFSPHLMRLTMVGVGSIIVGLTFILIAIFIELYEIGLARLTIAGELSDIFEPKPKV
jgi:hypothetical protein